MSQAETRRNSFYLFLLILAWKNVFIDIDYTSHEVEQQIFVPLMILMVESSQHYDEIQSNTRNRRVHDRYDLLVALDYDIRNMTRRSVLRDISLGGAYIETEQELEFVMRKQLFETKLNKAFMD